MKRLLSLLFLVARLSLAQTVMPTMGSTFSGTVASPTVTLQDSEDSANATTKNLVSSGGMAAGGGDVIICMANSSFTSTLTFTDTGGNTGYQRDFTFIGTGYADFTNYYSNHLTNPIAPGGHVTVAFSNGGSENWHCYLLYLSATASAGWFDNSPVSVTSFTGTSGTLTFTNSGTNGFSSGSLVRLSGFTGGNTGLNGQTVTVSATGLTTTQFEAPVTGSGYASGAGTAALSGTLNNTFGATQHSGTTATANASDFCIASFLGEASGWGTVTWNSGYAQLSLGTIVTAGRFGGVGWKSLSATGSQTMTISITASDNTNATIGCYEQ